MSLRGKVAIVTGASSGIGAQVARDLGSRGARLTLLARREDRLRAVARDIESGGGVAPLVVETDLRDEAAILASFESSQTHWGGLDVLVNNAGLGRSTTWHDGETDEWREMLDVNVLALSIAAREALRRFPTSGGHVVNVSSLAGHRVPPDEGFYAATKHFVRGMTESLRMELRARGSRTRVGSVSPGFVDTGFDEVFHSDPVARAGHRPSYRMLEPADVSAAVLYLLEAPPHVAIHDVQLRPSEQDS